MRRGDSARRKKHLYFVDVDDIIIITKDLREAIIRETFTNTLLENILFNAVARQDNEVRLSFRVDPCRASAGE